MSGHFVIKGDEGCFDESSNLLITIYEEPVAPLL